MIYKKSWKYILTRDDGYCIEYGYYRPKAIKDFSDIKRGRLGGYVDGYYNLSQTGKCWIYDFAEAHDKACVFENANIKGFVYISDYARVFGNARVYNEARIFGNAQIYDNAVICDNVRVNGNAQVYENAQVSKNAKISGNTQVSGFTNICGDVNIKDKVLTEGDYK